jgi:signal transduction histidine kinase
VLDNLLSNAIKFSPEGSQITISAIYLEGGGLKVSIADLGPGIALDLRQKIFEKYEIGSLITGINQIGLGLAFCKIAVEAHSGTISVTDNQPRGSIFTVEIPPQEQSAQESPKVISC